MVEQFLKFNKEENLFTSSQKILLAISGGADSMLMLHLFVTCGYNVSVAHCNFALRGSESDADEQFVTDYCEQNNISIYTKLFETKKFASENGISIEMAARDLRYEWFNELIDLYNFDLLATAHHLDDLIETFFINLARGCGIKGLSGIKAKTGKIIRPMLFANRSEIIDYCDKLNVEYRTDSSNAETIYKRNLIRHNIIPLLEDVNPAFRKNVVKTVSILCETELLFKQKINEIKSIVYSEDENGAIINIEKLLKFEPLKTILFELLKEFGFNTEQTIDIIYALKRESGRKFYSQFYRLIKDREYLLITPIKKTKNKFIYIDQNCKEINSPILIKIDSFILPPDYKYSTNKNIAEIDAEKLTFPLILRHRNEGEYFKPLGMEGFKKLSDFFIDEKFSIPEKENTWILASGNDIVWIVGKRIDDRFKITSNTKNIIRFTLG